MPGGSVLRGVAVPSGVLPSDPLRLQMVLLNGRFQPAAPPPCSTGGVRVRQRLFAEAALKDGPKWRKRSHPQEQRQDSAQHPWRQTLSAPHPSFSSSPLQSTTGPPLPMRSRVCRLTGTQIRLSLSWIKNPTSCLFVRLHEVLPSSSDLTFTLTMLRLVYTLQQAICLFIHCYKNRKLGLFLAWTLERYERLQCRNPMSFPQQWQEHLQLQTAGFRRKQNLLEAENLWSLN